MIPELEGLKLNPGQYNFDWLQDEIPPKNFDGDEYIYLDQEDIATLDLSTESDHLYLVKWKNLSYLESTWEHESQI